MDTPQPIRVHISPDASRDLILLNGLPLERLTEFTATGSVKDILVRTTYRVAGCFPVQGAAPDDALRNEVFPLRISLGHRTGDVYVFFNGRPIGHLHDVYIKMQSDPRRRIIRLTVHKMDQELLDALVDIKGVEVVIDPAAKETDDDFSGIEETTFNA